jgi:hypothetical protein
MAASPCDAHDRNGIAVIDDMLLRACVACPDVVLLGRKRFFILYDPKLSFGYWDPMKASLRPKPRRIAG